VPDNSDISFATSGIFSAAPTTLLAAIDAASSIITIDAGAFLFQRGDSGDALYAVGSGAIQIETSAADGRGRILNLMKPGDIFGEIALLDGGQRTADASAIGQTRLRRLSRRAFHQVLDAHPALARHLIEALCRRLRRLSAQAEDGAFLDIAGRLARRVLELADNPTGEVRISQEDLARHIGASRVSVNQHLQVWRGRGWVSLGRGRIHVHEREAIASFLGHRIDASRWGSFA
jgi:CRP/FNR family cyclic AMP-dependent transcriptional regulator